MPPQDAILSAISALKDSAPGPSGWTPQLLCIAAEVPECLALLHCLCSEIAAGTAPVPELFCASVLVAIPKKDGKVRPLAIGELVYRVLFKLLLRTNEWGKLLLDYQLGVGSRGSVEPVTPVDRSCRGRAASARHNSSRRVGFLQRVQLDRPALDGGRNTSPV